MNGVGGLGYGRSGYMPSAATQAIMVTLGVTVGTFTVETGVGATETEPPLTLAVTGRVAVLPATGAVVV